MGLSSTIRVQIKIRVVSKYLASDDGLPREGPERNASQECINEGKGRVPKQRKAFITGLYVLYLTSRGQRHQAEEGNNKTTLPGGHTAENLCLETLTKHLWCELQNQVQLCPHSGCRVRTR